MKYGFCLALVVSLVACGGKKEGRGLTDDERTQLADINGSLEAHEAARRSVGFVPMDDGGEATPGPGGTSGAMTKMLQDGRCQNYGADYPPEDVARPWTQEYTFGQNNCPVNLDRSWSWDSAGLTWRYNQSFRVLNSAYRDLNIVGDYSSSGFIQIRRGGAETTATGRFNYPTIDVTNVGKVQVEIGIQGSFTNLQQKVNVAMTMRVTDGFSHTAMIEYDGRKSETKWKVNGREIDHKDFLDVFSAFGLDQLLDRTLKIK